MTERQISVGLRGAEPPGTHLHPIVSLGDEEEVPFKPQVKRHRMPRPKFSGADRDCGTFGDSCERPRPNAPLLLHTTDCTSLPLLAALLCSILHILSLAPSSSPSRPFRASISL